MTLTQYADTQVGCLYVSGGQGQKLTPALIRKLEKRDSDYKRALKMYEKHAKAGESLVGYDCSGLIICYLLGNKLIARDYNANGIYYSLCAPIDRKELKTGDLVFKKKLTSSEVYHTGIYMGGGMVVHAKGRDYGVVREKLSAAGWNRYGRLKVYSEESEDEIMDLLKSGSKDAIARGQKSLAFLGYKGDMDEAKYGAAGDKTRKSVNAYKKAHGLSQDGRLDEITLSLMLEQQAAKHDALLKDAQDYAASVRAAAGKGKF